MVSAGDTVKVFVDFNKIRRKQGNTMVYMYTKKIVVVNYKLITFQSNSPKYKNVCAFVEILDDLIIHCTIVNKNGRKSAIATINF